MGRGAGEFMGDGMQVSQRCWLEPGPRFRWASVRVSSGEDLLDDGVSAVLLFGLDGTDGLSYAAC